MHVVIANLYEKIRSLIPVSVVQMEYFLELQSGVIKGNRFVFFLLFLCVIFFLPVNVISRLADYICEVHM